MSIRERAWREAEAHNDAVTERIKKEARRRARLTGGDYATELADLEDMARRGLLPFSWGVGDGYADPLEEADRAGV